MNTTCTVDSRVATLMKGRPGGTRGWLKDSARECSLQQRRMWVRKWLNEQGAMHAEEPSKSACR